MKDIVDTKDIVGVVDNSMVGVELGTLLLLGVGLGIELGVTLGK